MKKVSISNHAAYREGKSCSRNGRSLDTAVSRSSDIALSLVLIERSRRIDPEMLKANYQDQYPARKAPTKTGRDQSQFHLQMS